MGQRPLAPFDRRTLAVTAVKRYGSYRVITAIDDDGPKPAPGQFYMLATAKRWGGGVDERPFLPRAFSLLRENNGALNFLLEDVGPGTNRLCELGVGGELTLLGPLGRPFDPPPADQQPILVGGGVGIAPLAALSDQLGTAAPVLLGFRDRSHAKGADLFDSAQVATDDGSVGTQGLVTELLERELDASTKSPLVYACGPPAMLEAVRKLCEQRSIAAQLALEAPMACGFGSCFGCAVPTKDGYIRLCVDGPVIEAERLETALVPGSGH